MICPESSVEQGLEFRFSQFQSDPYIPRHEPKPLPSIFIVTPSILTTFPKFIRFSVVSHWLTLLSQVFGKVANPIHWLRYVWTDMQLFIFLVQQLKSGGTRI